MKLLFAFSQKPILLLEIGLTSIGAINFKGKIFFNFLIYPKSQRSISFITTADVKDICTYYRRYTAFYEWKDTRAHRKM